jgi:hypothetical protein
MGLSPKTAAPKRPEWVLAKYSCEGRLGPYDLGNEDVLRVLETPHGNAYAVIDGVTATVGGRYGAEQGLTAGQWAGHVVVHVLQHLLRTDTLTPEALPQSLWKVWHDLRTEMNIPPEEVLGAVFCLLRPTSHGTYELWRFGDCRWGYALADGTWVDSLGGGLGDNGRHAEIRAAAIVAAMKRCGLGADYAAELRKRTDHARATVLAELNAVGHAAMQAVRLTERGKQWCDSLDGLQACLHPVVVVPAGATRLVLASDGWLGVPHSVVLGDMALIQLRLIDPLVVGLNPAGVKASKGFVGPRGELLAGLDDRVLLELVWQA